MQRTTISLPEDVVVKLKVLAAQRRTSMAALIREAIEEKTQARPKPKSIGLGESRYSDTSRLAGEVRPVPRS